MLTPKDGMPYHVWFEASGADIETLQHTRTLAASSSDPRIRAAEIVLTQQGIRLWCIGFRVDDSVAQTLVTYLEQGLPFVLQQRVTVLAWAISPLAGQSITVRIGDGVTKG